MNEGLLHHLEAGRIIVYPHPDSFNASFSMFTQIHVRPYGQPRICVVQLDLLPVSARLVIGVGPRKNE